MQQKLSDTEPLIKQTTPSGQEPEVAKLYSNEDSMKSSAGVQAALFYGCISASMVFVNKALLGKFPYPGVFLAIQMLFTVGILTIFRALRVIDTLPRITSELLTKFLLPSMFYSINVCCSLTTLSAASVPVYTVIKRLTPMMALILRYLILNKASTWEVKRAVLCVFFGTVLTGLGDLRFDAHAYTVGVIATISQALYLTYIQKNGVQEGLKSYQVLYISCINCFPMFLFMSVLMGEIGVVSMGVPESGVLFRLLISLLLGSVLNFALFLCTLVNSALATCIMGVVKGVATIIIGFFTFGGQPLTKSLVAGIGLNTLGSILYTVAKYNEKQAKKEDPEGKKPNDKASSKCALESGIQVTKDVCTSHLKSS